MTGFWQGLLMLTIPERVIRRNGPESILHVCWNKWQAERALARRGLRFRTTDVEELARVYAAMANREFEGINALQDWANWRTIPRCLSGRVPDRPLRVLDLGCGTGGSTCVLAFYCPAGSRLTGYELALPLVEIARRRTYRHRSGGPVAVSFCCQGVTETLREPDGTPVAAGSVDLVNASGVVGHHLNRQSIAPLIEELRRVLRPGGVAMLDAGPTLRATALTEVMTAVGFCRLAHRRSWLLDPTGQVVFAVPGADGGSEGDRGRESQRAC